MAWFLGLFAFVFMSLSLMSHEWVVFGSSTIDGGLRHVESDLPVGKSSWGLWAGSVKVGDEWHYDAKVATVTDDKKEFYFDDQIPDWLGTTGLVLVVGVVVLVVGLVVIFVGLCVCCTGGGCLGGAARFKLFRMGMYLYLVADLLFFGSLIYFPYGLALLKQERRNPFALTITSTYGWGWGVVILVFVGALLLLLDKHVPNDKKPETEKLLSQQA